MTKFNYDKTMGIWYKGDIAPLYIIPFMFQQDIPVTASNWKKHRPTYGSCAIATVSDDTSYGLQDWKIVYNYRAPFFNDIEQFDTTKLKHVLKN